MAAGLKRGEGGARRGRGRHKGRATEASRGGGSGSEWLYGRRPVSESLMAGRRHFYELLLADSGREATAQAHELAPLRHYAQNGSIAVRSVARYELNELLPPGANHQGVALRASPYPYCAIEELLEEVDSDPNALLLLLDHIEDPQNLGSLLRTCDAVGVCGIIIPEDRAAGVTAAAVRASAGAAEHLRVARVVNLVRALALLKEHQCWITGLDMAAEDTRAYTEIDFSGRCVIVVGNEGSGMRRLVRENCDFVASLPMHGRVESLNAGVAGAILLYEILRQRAGSQSRER